MVSSKLITAPKSEFPSVATNAGDAVAEASPFVANRGTTFVVLTSVVNPMALKSTPHWLVSFSVICKTWASMSTWRGGQSTCRIYAATRATDSGTSSTITSSRVRRLLVESVLVVVTLPIGDKNVVTASATA